MGIGHGSSSWVSVDLLWIGDSVMAFSSLDFRRLGNQEIYSVGM